MKIGVAVTTIGVVVAVIVGVAQTRETGDSAPDQIANGDGSTTVRGQPAAGKSGDVMITNADVDAALFAYTEALNNSDYIAAWALLSDDFKNGYKGDFDDFSRWVSRLETISFERVDAVQNNPEGARVDVRMRYLYADSRSGDDVVQFLFTEEDGEVKITASLDFAD